MLFLFAHGGGLIFQEISPIGRIEFGHNIGASIERMRLNQPLTLMHKPSFTSLVSVPVVRSAFDPFQRHQKREILFEPAL